MHDQDLKPPSSCQVWLLKPALIQHCCWEKAARKKLGEEELGELLQFVWELLKPSCLSYVEDISAPDSAPTHPELISLLPSSPLLAQGIQDSCLALAIRSALPSLSGCCGTMPFTQRSLLPCFSLQQSHILLLRVSKNSLPQPPLHS